MVWQSRGLVVFWSCPCNHAQNLRVCSIANVNVDLLQKKLIAAARAVPPDERVPYAFERRIMALVASRAAGDELAQWVRGLWRAAVSCVAVALLLGTWAWLNPSARTSNTEDLSQNFESALLASVDQSDQAQ